jgi:hypothetical protein
MKILVTGSRKWPLAKQLVVFSYMNSITRGAESVTLLHGACPYGTDVPNSPYKGVDGLCDLHGRLLGWDVRPFPPDVSKGPSRFAIRNAQMVDEMPDRVLAFFLEGEKNAGTKMTHDMALAKNLYVVRIKA